MNNESLNDRFLDALLEEVYHSRPVDEVLKKVASKLDAVVTPVAAKPRSVRRPWVAAIITTTAILCLIISLAIMPQQASATETLRAVVAQVEAPEDRVYDVVTNGRIKITARLWVRGGDSFVLRLPSLIPNHEPYVWVGHHQGNNWLIPAIGPVLVRRKSDPEFLVEQLQKRQLSLPILHLSTVTRRLQTRYQPPVMLPDLPGLTHLQAKQQEPAQAMLPDIVDIVARQNIIQTLQLQWKATDSFPEPFTMTLTLIPQMAVPNNWFDHTTHHAETRRVLQFEENQP